MSNFGVRPLGDSEFSLWERFVNESPQGTLFHKTFWLKLSGLPFKILGCFRNEELVAGIPLVYQKRFGFTSIEPPPLTPYLGIVFQDNTALKYVSRLSFEKKITSALVDVLLQEGTVIQVRFQPGIFDLHPFMWAGFSTGIKYTYRLDVMNLDRVFQGMDARRRSEIRKAARSGLSVVHNAPLEEFIHLNQMTFERQEAELSVSAEELKRRHQVLQREKVSQIFIVKDEAGQLCGGVYIVWDSKCAYYLLGGFNPEFGNSGAVPLAIWEAIQHTSKTLQLPEFDFEGSNIPGIERSFREYGGRLTPYYFVYRAKPFIKLALFATNAIKSALNRQ